jgi:RNA polymerase sigma-70 factor, ECF subfamily
MLQLVNHLLVSLLLLLDFPFGGRRRSIRQGADVADERDEELRRMGAVAFRRCLQLLGDREAARDATQEVMIRMLANREHIDSPAAWIWRVSTNTCLHVLEKDRRLRFMDPVDLPEVPDDARGEERLAARQALASLIDRLDEKARGVFALVHVDGLTQEEAAEVLGLSRRTVGKKLTLIRELMEQLEAAT